MLGEKQQEEEMEDGLWVFDYMHLVSNCCDLCNDERGMRCIIMKMF